ncbi:DUF2059 domain-containing protein [Edaphobacter albus]|uniref:DUF2059 domain-containing protein n=1 Tax=Edaphobacter sp. 4G125 TaxID=2763071 RepID=UPI0016472A1B|nr:DUF2059 domain-containing protein [Edaphobacter sp. 4G125]QNI37189.1 DUF2059 domain-containing protein [Edaphobacter sp. 4G125]
MKRLSLFLLLVSLPLFSGAQTASSTASGNDSAKNAKVEELIRITKLDQLMTQMSTQMTARMKQAAAQQNARHPYTPDQQKAVDDYIAQIQKITQDAVSWDKVKSQVTTIYTETYTDSELDGILNFYRSPSGQAFISKSPQLMTKTMQLVNEQMTTVQPQIQKANEDFAHKMQELSSTPAPAPQSSQPAPATQPKATQPK